jgi:hypothetical protein
MTAPCQNSAGGLLLDFEIGLPIFESVRFQFTAAVPLQNFTGFPVSRLFGTSPSQANFSREKLAWVKRCGTNAAGQCDFLKWQMAQAD